MPPPSTEADLRRARPVTERQGSGTPQRVCPGARGRDPVTYFARGVLVLRVQTGGHTRRRAALLHQIGQIGVAGKAVALGVAGALPIRHRLWGAGERDQHVPEPRPGARAEGAMLSCSLGDH